MKRVMRIVWRGIDACDCGAGAPGEDYQLLYNITYDGATCAEWNEAVQTIMRVAKEFQTANEEGDTPCELLYDGDRLQADEYIVDRMAELMPDVIIDYCNPDGFTVEID